MNIYIYIAIAAILALTAWKIDDRAYGSGKVDGAAIEREIQIEACTKAKKTTGDANDKLSADNRELNDRVNTLLLRPQKCLRPTSTTSKSAGGDGYAGPDAIESGWLYSYAGECESYRRAVVTLQTFIQDERK